MSALDNVMKPASLVILARLRDWAWRVLLRDETAPPPEAAAAEWDLFLRMERVALPLQRAVPGELSGLAAERIHAHALGEIKQVMAARAELHVVEQFALAQHCSIILLKAAAALESDVSLALLDVDVLMDRQTVLQLAAFLRARDYQIREIEGEMVAVPPAALGGVPIDMHHEVKEWVYDPARAVQVRTGVARMSPPDHALHVLLHSHFRSVSRIGSLRDLVLLRSALQACTDADRADILAPTHLRDPVLLQAFRGAAGELPEDPFALPALARFSLAIRFGLGWVGKSGVEAGFFLGVLQAVSRGESLRNALARVRRVDAAAPDRHGWERALEKAPLLGSAFRTLVWSAFYGSTWSVARVLRGQARRALSAARRA